MQRVDRPVAARARGSAARGGAGWKRDSGPRRSRRSSDRSWSREQAVRDHQVVRLVALRSDLRLHARRGQARTRASDHGQERRRRPIAAERRRARARLPPAPATASGGPARRRDAGQARPGEHEQQDGRRRPTSQSARAAAGDERQGRQPPGRGQGQRAPREGPRSHPSGRRRRAARRATAERRTATRRPNRRLAASARSRIGRAILAPCGPRRVLISTRSEGR